MSNSCISSNITVQTGNNQLDDKIIEWIQWDQVCHADIYTFIIICHIEYFVFYLLSFHLFDFIIIIQG